ASVNYYTIDGTALDGSDYTGTSGRLSFAPGETSKTVTVNVSGDNTYEPDETLTLHLDGPLGAAGFGTQDATGTILNDDPVPTVSASSPSALEGTFLPGSLVFTVSLSNPSYQSTTVLVSTADG